MNVEPVVITDKAREEVDKILAKKEISPEYRLRVDVEESGAGCSKSGYVLGFDSKKDSDIEYENNGVKVLVDKKKVLFLVGLRLDYHDGDAAQGFFFEKVKKFES